MACQTLLLPVHIGADAAADHAADGGAGQDLVGLPLAFEDGAGRTDRAADRGAFPGPVAAGDALLPLGLCRGAAQDQDQ